MRLVFQIVTFSLLFEFTFANACGQPRNICELYWYVLQPLGICSGRPATHVPCGSEDNIADPIDSNDIPRANDPLLAEEPQDQQTYSLDANLFEGDIAGIDADSLLEVTDQAVQVLDGFQALSDAKSEHRELLSFDFLPDDIFHSAVRDPFRLWPNGKVPYVISDQFSKFGRSVIAKAMEQFHNLTCIRFVNKTERDSSYLHIKAKKGCWSYVGRQRAQPQEVSLAVGCVYTGTVMHELMHAVGFFHEHSRTDRDKYIKIIWENIKPKQLHNFQKYGSEKVRNLGTRYDYGSIMHYRRNSFGKSYKTTIETTNPKGAKIGQRKEFSDIDIKDLNRLYKCGKKCEDSKSYCKLSWTKKWCPLGAMQRNCKKTCGIC